MSDLEKLAQFILSRSPMRGALAALLLVVAVVGSSSEVVDDAPWQSMDCDPEALKEHAALMPSRSFSALGSFG
jgi:hypothetical protein